METKTTLGTVADAGEIRVEDAAVRTFIGHGHSGTLEAARTDLRRAMGRAERVPPRRTGTRVSEEWRYETPLGWTLYGTVVWRDGVAVVTRLRVSGHRNGA